MEDNNPQTRPPRSRLVTFIAVAMTVLVAVLTGLCYLQMKDIENGTVEAVAAQQDGYVQLVLDQISLQGDRADDEIIEDILGTLDSSAGRYWAFSKGQTMLYVKDSTETTRYRNLTADSYFSTESAEDFLKGLGERVAHGTIDINGQKYVASGVLFSCRGEDYRLCLLTNRDMLLESNAMLGARSRLMALLCVMLALLLAVPIVLAVAVTRTQGECDRLRMQLSRMTGAFNKLNDRLMLLDAYDVKAKLWPEDMMPKFEERARRRGVACAKAVVSCDDRQARDAFLKRGAVVLGRQVLRFSGPDNKVTLMLVGGTWQQLAEAVEMIETERARLVREPGAEVARGGEGGKQ